MDSTSSSISPDHLARLGDRLADAVLKRVEEPSKTSVAPENDAFVKARSFIATDCYAATSAVGALIPRLLLGAAHEGSLAHMVVTAGVVRSCLFSVFSKRAAPKLLAEWDLLPVTNALNLYTYQTVVVLVANGIAACLDQDSSSFVKVAAVFIAHFPPLQKKVMQTGQFKLLTKHVDDLLQQAKEEAISLVHRVIRTVLSTRVSSYKLPAFNTFWFRKAEIGVVAKAATDGPRLRKLILSKLVEDLPDGFKEPGKEVVDFHLRELEELISRTVVQGGSFLTTVFAQMYFLNRTALVLLASYPAFGALALLFGGKNSQSVEEIGLRVASAAALVWTRSPLLATMVFYSKSLVDYASAINHKRKILETQSQSVDETSKSSGLPATPTKTNTSGPYIPTTPLTPAPSGETVVSGQQPAESAQLGIQVAYVAALAIGPVLKSAVADGLEGPLLKATLLPGQRDLGVFTNPSNGVHLGQTIPADFGTRVTYRGVVLLAGMQMADGVSNHKMKQAVRVATFFASQVPMIEDAVLERESIHSLFHKLSQPLSGARESLVSALHPRAMRLLVANRTQVFRLLKQSGALGNLDLFLPKLRTALMGLEATAVEHCPSALVPASNALVGYHADQLVDAGAELIVRVNRNLVGMVVDLTAASTVRTAEYYVFYNLLLKVFENNPVIGAAGLVLAGGPKQSAREVAVRLFGAGVLFSTKSAAATTLIVRIGLMIDYCLKIRAWHLKKVAAQKSLALMDE